MPGLSFLTGLEGKVDRDVGPDLSYYWDEICGPYGITNEVDATLTSDMWKKRRVAWVLAERKTRGFKRAAVLLTSSSHMSPTMPSNRADWTAQSVEEILASIPDSPLEILEACLINLAQPLIHPSEPARVGPQDCWRLYSYDRTSVDYILGQLVALGFIKMRGIDPEVRGIRFFQIQAAGWEKLSALRVVARQVRNQAFVAMWFDPQMEEYFSGGFRPAIEEQGTTALRIDLKEHNNKICDEIVSEIRRSKFVVADFTGSRGGVYFEAGFAFGLGLPVIWTVRECDLSGVHFDTRQYNHITYSTPEELKTRLSNRIQATIV